MKTITIQTRQKNVKTVADKIRVFRDEFTRDYLQRHGRFDIHEFSKTFLEKTQAPQREEPQHRER